MSGPADDGAVHGYTAEHDADLGERREGKRFEKQGLARGRNGVSSKMTDTARAKMITTQRQSSEMDEFDQTIYFWKGASYGETRVEVAMANGGSQLYAMADGHNRRLARKILSGVGPRCNLWVWPALFLQQRK